MAQVHVAQRTGSDKICVLKRLKVSLADRDINVKRFAREAHVVAHLRHPRIAQVTDAGTVDNAIYMAMEFIPGKEAEAIMLHLLRTGRMMPYGASILIALATLDGLAYAHDAKDAKGEALELVHRDLSPRNVMVRFDGDVKIIDFGLARGNLDDFKTAPGMIMGTLRYMSPEQAMSVPVDRRSDLYSLSVWLWELLAGRLLLGQVEQNDWRPILAAVMNDVPPPLHTFNPNVPKALSDVVARGLAKRPDDRWQTAEQMQAALREAAGPLAATTPEQMAGFLGQHFGNEVLEAREIMALAGPQDVADAGNLTIDGLDDLAEQWQESTRNGFFHGLVAPVAAEETRGAFPAPQAWGGSPLVDEPVRPTPLTRPVDATQTGYALHQGTLEVRQWDVPRSSAPPPPAERPGAERTAQVRLRSSAPPEPSSGRPGAERTDQVRVRTSAPPPSQRPGAERTDQVPVRTSAPPSPAAERPGAERTDQVRVRTSAPPSPAAERPGAESTAQVRLRSSAPPGPATAPTSERPGAERTDQVRLRDQPRSSAPPTGEAPQPETPAMAPAEPASSDLLSNSAASSTSSPGERPGAKTTHQVRIRTVPRRSTSPSSDGAAQAPAPIDAEPVDAQAAAVERTDVAPPGTYDVTRTSAPPPAQTHSHEHEGSVPTAPDPAPVRTDFPPGTYGVTRTSVAPPPPKRSNALVYAVAALALATVVGVVMLTRNRTAPTPLSAKAEPATTFIATPGERPVAEITAPKPKTVEVSPTPRRATRTVRTVKPETKAAPPQVSALVGLRAQVRRAKSNPVDQKEWEQLVERVRSQANALPPARRNVPTTMLLSIVSPTQTDDLLRVIDEIESAE